VLGEVNRVRKIGNFLGGFFLGGLVGAAAGLLLAPYGGNELQNRIRGRVDALVEEGKEAAAARQAELEAQLEAFRRGESLPAE
jgi:gas vesicle protein